MVFLIILSVEWGKGREGCGWGATPFFPLKSREQFTKQLHHSVYLADSSLGACSRRARPVKGVIRKRVIGINLRKAHQMP
jgi:hypothetical protein